MPSRSSQGVYLGSGFAFKAVTRSSSTGCRDKAQYAVESSQSDTASGCVVPPYTSLKKLSAEKHRLAPPRRCLLSHEQGNDQSHPKDQTTNANDNNSKRQNKHTCLRARETNRSKQCHLALPREMLVSTFGPLPLYTNEASHCYACRVNRGLTHPSPMDIGSQNGSSESQRYEYGCWEGRIDKAG